MEAFLTAFWLIGVAELGDKSRLAGLMLASAFRAPWPVFVGMTLAYAALDGMAAAAGGALPTVVPERFVAIGAGLLFIAFGAAAIFFSEKAEASAREWLEKNRHWGPFAVSFAMIAVSEMGDRTQLATAALAGQTGRPWMVLGGCLSSLALLNAVTVWLGEALAKRVSMHLISRAAGVLFAALGVVMIWRAW